MNFSRLNPHDFKKWMNEHGEFVSEMEKSEIVGKRAETRFGVSRLIKHASEDSGKLSRVLADFAENGGVVKEARGDELLIEVKRGSFVIDRTCVIV